MSRIDFKTPFNVLSRRNAKELGSRGAACLPFTEDTCTRAPELYQMLVFFAEFSRLYCNFSLRFPIRLDSHCGHLVHRVSAQRISELLWPRTAKQTDQTALQRNNNRETRDFNAQRAGKRKIAAGEHEPREADALHRNFTWRAVTR